MTIQERRDTIQKMQEMGLTEKEIYELMKIRETTINRRGQRMTFTDVNYTDNIINGTEFCNDLYLEDLLLKYGISKTRFDEFAECLTEEQKTDWNLIENCLLLIGRDD